MSCIISISDQTEDRWVIRNAIHEWFINLVLERFGGNAALSEKLKQSVYFHGLGLDDLHAENPSLAIAAFHALATVAEEVAKGSHPLKDPAGRPWPEFQRKVEQSFSNLVALLQRFRNSTLP